ncbi:MAG: extracellular solute-binding protein [Sediminicola sp.]
MIRLKGMAWDHPRGYLPLRALSQEFNAIHPDIQVLWDVRSLKEFGDTPIELLIDSYDLITIDHPYMGQAHHNGLLVPMEKYFSPDQFNQMAKEYVGPSFDSYSYKGHMYALPIDAAALVAAYNKESFSSYGLTVPTTRKTLKNFHKGLPRNCYVAWPLCATDLWCSFLSLCAQDGGRDFIKGYDINRTIGSQVLDEIKYHLDFLHPESINWNPISVLEEMASGDTIPYAPYLFGYSNYARSGYGKNLVGFANSPNVTKGRYSTILGGVGLAVSSKSNYVEEAVSFAAYVASAEVQIGSYTKNAGQPAHLGAWQDHGNNELCNGFFSDTIKTFGNAYVRPRHPKWNQFQERSAELLHDGILKDVPSMVLMDNLNEHYKSLMADEHLL